MEWLKLDVKSIIITRWCVNSNWTYNFNDKMGHGRQSGVYGNLEERLNNVRN